MSDISFVAAFSTKVLHTSSYLAYDKSSSFFLLLPLQSNTHPFRGEQGFLKCVLPARLGLTLALADTTECKNPSPDC